MRVAKIAHEAPAANRAVHFERRSENHILKRQTRTPDLLRRLTDAFAQFMQKLLKLTFLVYLSRVITRPFLAIGFLDGDSFGIGLSLAIIRVLTLGDDLDSVKVFASALPRGEVRASAMRFERIGFDLVVNPVMAALRRNKPSVAALLQLRRCSYH